MSATERLKRVAAALVVGAPWTIGALSLLAVVGREAGVPFQTPLASMATWVVTIVASATVGLLGLGIGWLVVDRITELGNAEVVES